ncbi:hypothetical protein [Leclercia adecarboxylata]|uniref:oxidoreductase n=1 Tax=Leclercia adecarboxylata TaxID=83655 RepID=UPI0038505ECC
MNVLKFLESKKFFFLPVNTGFGQNGEPDNKLIEFYRKRSGNNIYCSIVGNIVIPNGFGSNDQCLFISESDKWEKLSSAINENNTIAGIQLSSAWPNYIGNRGFVSSSSSTIDNYLSQAKNISIAEIDKIADQLQEAVNLSIQHGFKHIQLHAGHGYLFSLLLDSVFCDNSEYALNKVRTIFSNLPRNIESSLRFSLLTGMQRLDKQRKQELTIEKLLMLPFNTFDISFGFYNINKHMIYPETNSMLKSRTDKSLELSITHPNKNFIISGRSLRKFKDQLPENVDIGICRDLIANPSFLKNLSDGCTLCGKCHYYSRGETHITCGSWEVYPLG